MKTLQCAKDYINWYRLKNGQKPLYPDAIQNTAGSDGGFLVSASPTDTAALTQAVADVSIFYKLCRKIPITEGENTMNLPAFAETSRANGSRYGGVRVYWTSEGVTVTATQPKLRNIFLKLEKLLAITPSISNELLADASTLSAWLLRAFAGDSAFKFDEAFVNGSGNGQMLGILNCPALIVAPSNAASLGAEDLYNMWGRRARGKSDYIWICNPELEKIIAEIIANEGGSIADALTIFGRPVIPCETCSEAGTLGDLVLCSPSDYIVAELGEITMESSGHTQGFLSDSSVVKIRWRINGTPYSHLPTVPYNGTVLTSPYVTLNTRGVSTTAEA